MSDVTEGTSENRVVRMGRAVHVGVVYVGLEFIVESAGPMLPSSIMEVVEGLVSLGRRGYPEVTHVFYTGAEFGVAQEVEDLPVKVDTEQGDGKAPTELWIRHVPGPVEVQVQVDRPTAEQERDAKWAGQVWDSVPVLISCGKRG